MEKDKVDATIKAFATFLSDTWDTVHPLLLGRSYTTDIDSIGDWMQANWELLVERRLVAGDQCLEIYSSGADFYGFSSRITDPEAHRVDFVVAVKPTENFSWFKENHTFDYLNQEKFSLGDAVFEEFVSFKNKFYHIESPFEYALLKDNGLERVVKLSDITFELKKTTPKSK